MKIDVPEITVIIPMYNAAKYVEQAIDSVLNQTFKDLNVLIIDDCSTDGSFELVQSRYGDNERVTLMRNRKNLGFTANKNLGLRLASGKYIAMLDDDDVFLPGGLEVLHNIAEHYKADVVSSYGTLHSHDANIPRDFSGPVIPEIFGTPFKDCIQIAPGSDRFEDRIELYLRGEFGSWCAWNKLYSRQFLMENDIFYPPMAHDRGFSLKCFLSARTYIKVPIFLNIYRNGIESASRKPPSLEALSRKPIKFSVIASDYDKIMRGCEFLERNPFYRYQIIDYLLSEADRVEVMSYYRDNKMLTSEMIEAFDKHLPEDFGDNAPYMLWLFNRYHRLHRHCLELTARLKRLEESRT